MKFYPLDKLLKMIEGSNKKLCISLLEKNTERFYLSPGSRSKHQNWKGGYVDHLEETMSMAVNFYKLMFKVRKPDFSLSDALFVLFLHDLEKPFKYIEPKIIKSKDRNLDKDFVTKMLIQENIKLSKAQLNAFAYIHGEGEDYHPTKRIQNPVGAFCHMCDNASARIWFDYPKRG